jgi:hypothetical protein
MATLQARKPKFFEDVVLDKFTDCVHDIYGE